jgi:hypothetical protein
VAGVRRLGEGMGFTHPTVAGGRCATRVGAGGVRGAELPAGKSGVFVFDINALMVFLRGVFKGFDMFRDRGVGSALILQTVDTARHFCATFLKPVLEYDTVHCTWYAERDRI